jgi:predicted NBD/HSP70 family sugar kinase
VAERKRDSRRSTILYQLWKEGPISRGQLAENMDLNLPTVSAIVQDLLKTKELIEEGYATSTGGRKAQLLDVNPSRGGIIAVEFSSKGILSASADMKGRLNNHQVHPFQVAEGKDAALKGIFRAIDEQIEFLRTDEHLDAIRIGIVVSGLVDDKQGISIKFPRFEEWQNVPLRDIVQKKYKIPADLTSHVVATTLAEATFGRFKNTQNGLYVHLGPGLGAGLVIDGQVHRGTKSTIGEFGHVTIDDKGPICYCGNYGCLETVASDYALVLQAEQALKEGVQSHIPEHIDDSGHITPLAVFRAAEMGDRFAANILDKAGHYLGTALANIINLLAPEQIVFGGTMVEEGDRLIRAIQTTVRRRALEALERDIEFRTSTFRLQAGVVGAVATALNQHYASFNGDD